MQRYALFKRVEALKDMRAAFSVYVRRRGMESVQDEERDKEMVQTLLDLKEKLDKMIKEAFSANEAFDRTLRDAFEHFINCRENRPAQLIAKFMDLHLRAGNKVTQQHCLCKTYSYLLLTMGFLGEQRRCNRRASRQSDGAVPLR